MKGALLTDLGLRPGFGWLRDPWLYLAAAVAVPAVMGLRAWLGEAAHAPARSTLLIVSIALWQPAIEELLFRGVIQGRLRGTPFGQWRMAGITGANLAASVLFAIAHGVHHAPAWAGAVLAPSLVFGLMRDRHDSVYPGFALHCAYNGLYLLAGLP